jgi:hypothetical protein
VTELLAVINARFKHIDLAKGFWPQLPFLPSETLPACSWALEFCLIGFFLPELLVLVVLSILYYAIFGNVPALSALSALQGLATMTLVAFGGIALASLIYPMLGSHSTQRTKINNLKL